jgi:hypothetical protein
LIEKKTEEVYRCKGFEELQNKLAMMKRKCDGLLESSMEDGVHQIQEHCDKMRNNVHLRAEILIEQVHQMDESMIAEINEYEKACVDSFNSKISDYRIECVNLLVEMKNFQTSTSKYMNEFKINEKVIEGLLANINKYYYEISLQNKKLEKIKFNDQFNQFWKSSFEFEEELIGSIENKYLMFQEL